MRILQLTAIVFLFNISHIVAQPITWAWSKSMGGSSTYDLIMDMTKDPAGNVYVTGDFNGTRTFGSTILAAQGFYEIFVAKYDVNGVFQWAIKGGANFAVANAGGIVFVNNNLYVTGTFSSTFNYGGMSLISTGQSDVFLMQLDPATGNPNWLEKAGGTNADKALDIAAAPNGEIVITGTFTTSADFGTYNVSNGTLGNIDMYLAKYSSAGTCLWASMAGGANADESKGIVINSFGVIYITGYFQETAVFSPTISVTSIFSYDYFLAKYSPTGSALWVQTGGGNGTVQGAGLGLDQNGDVYVNGYFSDTATFGPYTLYDNTAGNIFLAKYNGIGQILWAFEEGGFTSDIPAAISTDALGGSYVTGFIAGNSNFSGFALVGSNDPYIAKYDKDGNIRWALVLNTTGLSAGRAILADANGYCYLGGYYLGSISLGPIVHNAPTGDFGTYLARLSGGTVGIDEALSATFEVYPNPTSDYLNINVEEVNDDIFTVEVLSADGKVVLSEKVGSGKILQKYVLNVSSLASGNYILQLSCSKGDVAKPFIVNRF